MPKIHPTAIVHPDARVADEVEIGPYCLVESDVRIGPGTVLRNHVTVRRYTTLGSNNVVDANAVLGGEPQDLKFDPATVSFLRIGNDNVFREGVTISRATGERAETTVGNETYWMANAHAGHNAVIADNVVLVNNVAVAGHATIGRQAILSGGVNVHQFCWIGEMVMSQGNAGTSTHVPPYTLFAHINVIVSLNLVGLRRAEHLTDDDRRQIKEAFHLLYRSKLTPAKALEKMDGCTDWGAPADVFRQFIRRVVHAKPPYDRGIARIGRRR